MCRKKKRKSTSRSLESSVILGQGRMFKSDTRYSEGHVLPRSTTRLLIFRLLNLTDYFYNCGLCCTVVLTRGPVFIDTVSSSPLIRRLLNQPFLTGFFWLSSCTIEPDCNLSQLLLIKDNAKKVDDHLNKMTTGVQRDRSGRWIDGFYFSLTKILFF